MTREEARNIVANADLSKVPDDVIKAFFCLCISNGKEKYDVLDKIREEIEHHRRKTQYIDPYDLVGDCLDIIDKYKIESEDEECK